MANFKMKCPECSFEFEGDSQIEKVVCKGCNKEISTLKAIRYYESLQKIATDKIIVAQGEAYQKVDQLLEECKWFLQNQEYDNALMVTEEALSFSNSDGRIYMMRVYAKTKNFTDYEDESHYSDFKKAIELSSALEKENIKKIYAPYHRKRIIPKEELEEYEIQEADSKLKKVEHLLKDQIPKHFTREKSLKGLLISFIITSILFIASLIVSVAINDFYLSLISAVIFIASFTIISIYLTTVKKTKTFNTVLDLFDSVNLLSLSSKNKLELSRLLEKFAISTANGESPAHGDIILFEIVELLASEKTSKEYVLKDKLLKKFI